MRWRLALRVRARPEEELLFTLESSVELVNTTAHVNQLLLAGKERMTLRANFNLHFPAGGRLGLYHIAASADDGNVFIGRMNSCLHVQ